MWQIELLLKRQFTTVGEEVVLAGKPEAAASNEAESGTRQNSKLSAAALRALAEAQARRLTPVPQLPPEFNGRGGLEPVRYGDWETNGLASDF